MEQENLNVDSFNSVNFLFARPAYQGHYYFALDDINSMQIIDKDSLRGLLVKLRCGDFIKTNYLLDRNFPFFYDVKKKELLEFQETNIDITKEELTKYIHDELNSNLNQENNKTPYEKFFGNDSDFYKQNFYDIMNKENNTWQSSTNTKQRILAR